MGWLWRAPEINLPEKVRFSRRDNVVAMTDEGSKRLAAADRVATSPGGSAPRAKTGIEQIPSRTTESAKKNRV
jgi:hypothetical protein